MKKSVTCSTGWKASYINDDKMKVGVDEVGNLESCVAKEVSYYA